MKPFFKSCLNQGVEFFKRNGSVLAGIALTAVGLVISKKFNIPLGYDLKSTPYRDFRQSSYPNMVFIPRNPVEASILSIFKSTENMSWDSDMIRAAEDICQIVNENNVSDDTRSFAITILSDMSEKLNWDSDRRKLNKLIMNITKGNI